MRLSHLTWVRNGDAMLNKMLLDAVLLIASYNVESNHVDCLPVMHDLFITWRMSAWDNHCKLFSLVWPWYDAEIPNLRTIEFAAGHFGWRRYPCNILANYSLLEIKGDQTPAWVLSLTKTYLFCWMVVNAIPTHKISNLCCEVRSWLCKTSHECYVLVRNTFIQFQHIWFLFVAIKFFFSRLR